MQSTTRSVPETRRRAQPFPRFRAGTRTTHDLALLGHVSARPGALVGPSDAGQLPRTLAVKHALDRVLAGLLVAVLAPLLVGLAVLVKLSSEGPVLYRQRRVGRHGQAFDILKFRTMRVGATVAGFRPPPGAAPGGVEGVDRRTAVGRLMRRTSLDELPQLLNVLRGEMSLVGPRPERPEFVQLFADEIPGYAHRHRMKVGITGLAQVRGLRGQTSLFGRVAADNEYVDTWSLVLDAKVLARTLLAVLKPAD